MHRTVVRAIAGMVLLLFLSNSSVFAQRMQMDKDTWVKNTLTSMTEAVGLSGEQSEQIKPILEEQFDKQTELRTAMRDGGDRSGMREAMTDLRNEIDEKIIALLSEDQIPKFKTYREESLQRRGPRRGGTQ